MQIYVLLLSYKFCLFYILFYIYGILTPYNCSWFNSRIKTVDAIRSIYVQANANVINTM